MLILHNYVRTETGTDSLGREYLRFICKCDKCGEEYRVNNIGAQKNPYCNECKKILAEERRKQVEDNHKKKAYDAIKKDLKRLIDDVSQKCTMQIDGKCYIKRSDVTEAINNYFSK